ncbi:hypothetical protein [Nonomuraea recticatena]|uniref:hypothetical protein n=1 Tax=Nonomuraea recticatena TaxID=46178 RepID=UPI00361474AF
MVAKRLRRLDGRAVRVAGRLRLLFQLLPAACRRQAGGRRVARRGRGRQPPRRGPCLGQLPRDLVERRGQVVRRGAGGQLAFGERGQFGLEDGQPLVELGQSRFVGAKTFEGGELVAESALDPPRLLFDGSPEPARPDIADWIGPLRPDQLPVALAPLEEPRPRTRRLREGRGGGGRREGCGRRRWGREGCGRRGQSGQCR